MAAVPHVIGHADGLVGNVLEQSVRSHHRRRLKRLGHAGVLDSSATELWGPAALPPRPGNSLEVLVDGETALGAVFDALTSATSHVHIAGWHLTPGFRLRRDDGTPQLVDLLAELAQRLHVRVLLWAGPPLPAFKPTRSMMNAVRDDLTTGTKVRCALDARERTLHCHHEKVIVVDDEIAFVGGIDLSDLSGDRWDRQGHPPRGAIGWHDVSTRLRGPIVADVAQHFRDRWQEVAHEEIAEPVVPPPAGRVTVQLVRTVAERQYRFAPDGEFTILDGYLRALRSARRFIYLENQFLWSSEIVKILVDKLRHPPTPDFRIVLVLPSRPSSGADTTRGQLGCLVEADNGDRLLAATLIAEDGQPASAAYVHAKVGIVDDRWLTIGSANLNEHSLFNDTEVNVITVDPELARGTRFRLWAEHLDRPESDIDGDPSVVIDTFWKVFAEEQLARTRAGLVPTRRISRLPAVSRRSERLSGPARGLLVDG